MNTTNAKCWFVYLTIYEFISLEYVHKIYVDHRSNHVPQIIVYELNLITKCTSIVVFKLQLFLCFTFCESLLHKMVVTIYRVTRLNNLLFISQNLNM